MTYIGVDLHKANMAVVCCDAKGEIICKERIPCKCIGKIEEFFAQPHLHPCNVVIESVGFYHWLFDLLEGKVENLVLANPVETKKYSWNEPKTDFRDARKLALLLAGGEFERNRSLSCFVPDKTLRTFRELTRYRHNLVCRHTSLVNSAHRILLKNNLAGPKILNGQSLELFLSRFGDKFSLYHKDFLMQISENLFYNERQLKEAEEKIQPFLHMDRFKQLYEILTSIPGIGDTVSATLISEIGDFSRFDHPDKLASYAGLCPRVFASDATVRYGRITKKGSGFLRRALINAAWVSIREDMKPRRIFNRVCKRAGRKKAVVAIARKLLVWIWYLVAEGEKWEAVSTRPDSLTNNKSGVTLIGLLKRTPYRVNSVA